MTALRYVDVLHGLRFDWQGYQIIMKTVIVGHMFHWLEAFDLESFLKSVESDSPASVAGLVVGTGNGSIGPC